MATSSDRELVSPSLGLWGNLESFLGGAMHGHQHSRGDLDREPPRYETEETRNLWGASSPLRGGSGAESPLTVVAAEDAASSRGPSASPGRVDRLDPEAAMLHQVLEQLQTALKAWESSVKSSTTLAGSFRPQRDYRSEEQQVNAASVAFEDFHAKLGKGSLLSDRALTRGNELLRALEGRSPWDAKKIRDLLLLRADYFMESKWDPESSRFTAARHFLELVAQKVRWPEAEAYALRWPENVERVLGSNGKEAWLARAKLLPKKHAPTTSRPSKGCCGLPNLLEEKVHEAKPQKMVSGCLSFSKIRAWNLRSADLLDDSDPFVKFELGTVSRPVTTSVVWNNEKNPEWRDPRTGAWETLQMPVTGVERLPELVISVYDQDTFSANDPLGNCRLAIMELIERQAGRLGSLKREVCFPTGPLQLVGEGAGDQEPRIEMEITWTPSGVGILAGPSDPLLLPLEEDAALQLLADMEEQLPLFLRSFGPQSPDCLGFFLQPEDHRTDSTRMVLPQGGNSDKVRQYNQVLNRIKEQLYQFRKTKSLNLGELDSCLEQARRCEASAADRRVFAFQDEYLPDIGEWSTDRRRQLRNQVFLVKLEHGVEVDLEETWHSCEASWETAWRSCLAAGRNCWHGFLRCLGSCYEMLAMLASLYLVAAFLALAVVLMVLSFWAMTHLHDRGGRGRVLTLASLVGLMSLAVAGCFACPLWKRYFRRPGDTRYQTVPPA